MVAVLRGKARHYHRNVYSPRFCLIIVEMHYILLVPELHFGPPPSLEIAFPPLCHSALLMPWGNFQGARSTISPTSGLPNVEIPASKMPVIPPYPVEESPVSARHGARNISSIVYCFILDSMTRIPSMPAPSEPITEQGFCGRCIVTTTRILFTLLLHPRPQRAFRLRIQLGPHPRPQSAFHLRLQQVLHLPPQRVLHLLSGTHPHLR